MLRLISRNRRQVIEARYRDQVNRAALSYRLAAGIIDEDRNLEERINRWIKLAVTLADARKNFLSSNPQKFSQARTALETMGIRITTQRMLNVPRRERLPLGPENSFGSSYWLFCRRPFYRTPYTISVALPTCCWSTSAYPKFHA